MASEVGVCNRALQHLGAQRITSLTQDHPNARECNAAYEAIRDRELRKHRWSFAKKRAELAALSDSPPFGFDNQFQLPSDCLKLLREEHTDWVIEGRKILTDDGAPLQIRYIARITDVNTMDPTFREVLSAALAYDLAERITQSNTKKRDLRVIYNDAVTEARRANAVERGQQAWAEDDWVRARK